MLLTAISTSTTREEKDLVSGCPAGIKVEARIGQGTNNEHRIGNVVVLPLGDDIPPLTVGSAAVGYLDGCEIGSEVAR